MIAALRHAFPADNIVGEEDSDILRQERDKRELLWKHVMEVLDEGLVDETDIGSIEEEGEMMDLIDRGNHEGGAVGSM